MPTPIALTPAPGRSAWGRTLPVGVTIETCPAPPLAHAIATVPSPPVAASIPTELPAGSVAAVIGGAKTLAALPRASRARLPLPAATSDRPPATKVWGAELLRYVPPAAGMTSVGADHCGAASAEAGASATAARARARGASFMALQRNGHARGLGAVVLRRPRRPRRAAGSGPTRRHRRVRRPWPRHGGARGAAGRWGWPWGHRPSRSAAPRRRSSTSRTGRRPAAW